MAGQWALVTGGGSGIGQAIAVCLATEGFNVAVTGRNVDKLRETEALCKEAGAQEVEVLACDLSESAATQELADGLLSRHGGVEVLVNNAGVMAKGNPLEGDPPEDIERMMALNVNAPVSCSAAAT